MATHSSILAWKISWTEEPGGLPFPSPEGSISLRCFKLRASHGWGAVNNSQVVKVQTHWSGKLESYQRGLSRDILFICRRLLTGALS